jgi:hypothetical protein
MNLTKRDEPLWANKTIVVGAENLQENRDFVDLQQIDISCSSVPRVFFFITVI